ncbi:MAG: DUF45 domain-containing protein [Bacteroidales bacterium]|nr:DUF45 domain-containing protein [Bacteroidales bacterium]
MEEKIVEFDDIGTVCFIREVRNRNLRISIRPHQGVQVVVPENVSFKDAGHFVQRKKRWIIRQQVRQANFEKGITLFDTNTDFKTCERSLRLHTHEKSTIRVIINKEYIHIYYPDFANVKDNRIQETVRRAIVEAWRIEAKKLLPVMTDHLARIHGFQYNKICIRNNKSRWGSCSRNNNLNLNLHLIRLPQHLCEYVILHELAHTIHKNHQKPFWALLDQMTENAKKLDRELSKYRLEVW